MKKNKPRTISDLKFNWEFVNYETGYPSIEIAQEQVFKKNLKLKKFRIVPNWYLILIDDERIHLHFNKNERVVDFFEIICFRFFIRSITGKFSHFERIDDQTYRIHMKK